MQPLSLLFKGFRGIRDGLGQDTLSLDLDRLADGAELIAISDTNGRGKTTVKDNMHPYLTMPSRAALSGPGGFSYYDQVCLPENEKNLTWGHAGRCYRSPVVICPAFRKRTRGGSVLRRALGESILRAAQLDGVKGQTVDLADAREWLLAAITFDHIAKFNDRYGLKQSLMRLVANDSVQPQQTHR